MPMWTIPATKEPEVSIDCAKQLPNHTDQVATDKVYPFRWFQRRISAEDVNGFVRPRIAAELHHLFKGFPSHDNAPDVIDERSHAIVLIRKAPVNCTSGSFDVAIEAHCNTEHYFSHMVILFPEVP